MMWLRPFRDQVDKYSNKIRILGNIVKMHETMIDRIDNNTDNALHNVKKAREELGKTL